MILLLVEGVRLDPMLVCWFFGVIFFPKLSPEISGEARYKMSYTQLKAHTHTHTQIEEGLTVYHNQK